MSADPEGRLEERVAALSDALALRLSTATPWDQLPAIPPFSRRDQLGYNDLDLFGRRRDPEQADGPLPFVRLGWSERSILGRLSQVDDDDMILTNETMCAALCVLATHILAGPGAVAILATSALARAEARCRVLGGAEYRADSGVRLVLDNLEQLREALGSLPERLAGKRARYRDLRRLAHLLKLLVDDDPSSGTNRVEYRALMSFGRVASSFCEAAASGVGLLRCCGEQLLESGLGPVGLVLSISAHEEPRLDTNHAVVLLVDASGDLGLFDPWPRRGRQLLRWERSAEEICDYARDPSGRARPWRSRALIALA